MPLESLPCYLLLMTLFTTSNYVNVWQWINVMVVCTVVIQMLVIPLVVSSRRAHVTNFLNDTVLPVVENICSHYRLRSKAISRSVLSVCLLWIIFRLFSSVMVVLQCRLFAGCDVFKDYSSVVECSYDCYVNMWTFTMPLPRKQKYFLLHLVWRRISLKLQRTTLYKFDYYFFTLGIYSRGRF